MAGAHLSSKTSTSSISPILNKAANVVSTITQGVAIARGIRQAYPVVAGLVRGGAALLPFGM